LPLHGAEGSKKKKKKKRKEFPPGAQSPAKRDEEGKDAARIPASPLEKGVKGGERKSSLCGTEEGKKRSDRWPLVAPRRNWGKKKKRGIFLVRWE